VEREVIREVPVIKEVERIVYVDRPEGRTSRNETVTVQVCVRVCTRAYVCVCACVCACMRVCVCLCLCLCLCPYLCVCICVCVSAHTYPYIHTIKNTHKTPRTHSSTHDHTCAYKFEHILCILQGGKDPQDALSCRSFFAKEPLITGLFCGKRPVKIRHAMGLHHPVLLT